LVVGVVDTKKKLKCWFSPEFGDEGACEHVGWVEGDILEGLAWVGRDPERDKKENLCEDFGEGEGYLRM
jgi:hypothetical protein